VDGLAIASLVFNIWVGKFKKKYITGILLAEIQRKVHISFADNPRSEITRARNSHILAWDQCLATSICIYVQYVLAMKAKI